MNPVMTPEIREVIEAVHYLPSVSIIMPFEPSSYWFGTILLIQKNIILNLQEGSNIWHLIKK